MKKHLKSQAYIKDVLLFHDLDDKQNKHQFQVCCHSIIFFTCHVQHYYDSYLGYLIIAKDNNLKRNFSII